MRVVKENGNFKSVEDNVRSTNRPIGGQGLRVFVCDQVSAERIAPQCKIKSLISM
jgi:hypothetical protein